MLNELYTTCEICEADNPRKSSFSPVNSYWNWTKRRLASTALLLKSDTLGCCRHMVLEQLKLPKTRCLARTVSVRCARQEVLDNFCCSNAIHGQPVYAQIAQNNSWPTGDGEWRAVPRCLYCTNFQNTVVPTVPKTFITQKTYELGRTRSSQECSNARTTLKSK